MTWSPGWSTITCPASATFVANPTADDLQRATGAIARADALVDTDLLDRTPLLKVVARTGVGVDRVDVDEATRRGIAVVVTPGAGTNAVAEGTLAMTLHLVKRLRVATACVAEGRWAERGPSRWAISRAPPSGSSATAASVAGWRTSPARSA